MPENIEEVKNKISEEVEKLKDEAVNILMDLIRIPALGPENGGEGEYDKAMKLLEILERWGFDKIERYDAPDPRAKHGIRPNILAYYYGEDGEKSKRIWILSHLDVVPPGNLGDWTITKPFEPLVKNGKIYGRGSEDNGQSIVSSLIAVKALMNLGIRPKRTIVLAFVSDEETGSEYGLKWLIQNHPEIFRDDDLVLVPDGGNPDGTFIEIAEKSILWFKIKVKGKQVHGSMPHLGLNAHRVAMDLALEIDRMLHEKYSAEDPLFVPSVSTFEPTMVKNSADSPNIIAGEHEIVFDCRILPQYNLDKVLEDIKLKIEEIKRKYRKVLNEEELPQVELEIIQRVDAPRPTPKDSEIVQKLKEAIKILRGKEAYVGGIGGGTFAAFFRMKGIPAVVWATLDETAHKPNEYAKIENIIEDAKVMALLSLL